MIKVHFYGNIREKFGTEFSLDAKTPGEIIRALCTQLPGLEEAIKAGNWHVLRGRLDEQDDISEESLHLEFGEQKEMHLMPAIEGSGSGGGIFQVIVGAALVVGGIFVTPFNPALGAAMIGAGAGMMIGGIVMMTMRPPKGNTNNESPDQRASFLFSRPTNSSTQGVAIPRGYGRFRVGSVVVSTSIVAEEFEKGVVWDPGQFIRNLPWV